MRTSKSRILALFLCLCMVLTLVPAVALAAEAPDNDFWNYRQKWLYEVTADKNSTEGTSAGTNIRDKTDPVTEGAMPIQTYDLGKVSYGSPTVLDGNTLTLKLKT